MQIPNETNSVPIARRDCGVYINTIVLKLQKFDELIIKCKHDYLVNAEYVINLFLNFGLMLEDGGRKFKWRAKEEEVTNGKSGNTSIETVYIIKLLKHPDFFKFTKN